MTTKIPSTESQKRRRSPHTSNYLIIVNKTPSIEHDDDRLLLFMALWQCLFLVTAGERKTGRKKILLSSAAKKK
jgi:hypothetical protein